MNFYTFQGFDGKPMHGYIKAHTKIEAKTKAKDRWGDTVDLETCLIYKGVL